MVSFNGKNDERESILYISEISINNFRIFNNFTVQFNKGLNVLIGENNGGKTSLIDAIRLTLDTNSSEWTKILDTDFHQNEESFHIQIKFDDILPKQAAVFVEHLTHETTEKNKRKSVLYVNLKAQVTNVIKKGSRYIRSELRSGAKVDGPQIEREIREYLSATYLRPLRDAESELSAGRYSRLAQIISSSRQFSRDGKHFKDLLEAFIAASKGIEGNEGLKSDKTNIDNSFKKLVFVKDNFNLAIQMLGSIDFDKMSTSEKERAFQDVLRKLSLVMDVDRPLQGLGYNNLLFMATELLLLQQETEEFPLLLIEEPEAHLHPQLQMKFLKFVNDEYSSKDKPNLQTIITTHSPNLTSKASLESIILMKDAKAFSMKKGMTSLDDNDYVFLEKFLDVTKANLFFAKGVLIVEGDGENILLPTIAECLGHPLEDYGVSIVNVGSTAYARFAKIFVRKLAVGNEDWLKIPVACLRDLDLWPEKADEAVDGQIGWKILKKGNENFWLPRNDLAGDPIGTSPIEKKKTLEKLSQQNVKVFVSDEWTFEYCLIQSGLDDLIVQALGGLVNLSNVREERYLQIYRKIDETKGAKTELAYKLSELLRKDYATEEKRNELLAKLPNYIKAALKHALNLRELSVAKAVPDMVE